MTGLLAETLIPLTGRELLVRVGLACALVVIGWIVKRRQPAWRNLTGTACLIIGGLGVVWCAGNWLLTHLPGVPPEVGVILTPMWSWEWVFGISAGLLILVATTYPDRVRHMPRLARRMLIGLRYMAAGVLIFGMMKPGIQWTRQDKQSAVFYVVTDVSRSMGTKDTSGGRSRYETQTKLLDDAAKLFEQLKKQGTIEFLEFGEKLTVAEQPSSVPTAQQTGIGHALEQLRLRGQGKKIAGGLLISDGAQRALPPINEDPRRAARLLGEQQFPINTVTLGASQIEGTSVDVALENLQTSPTVFVKNQAVVRANVRAQGAAGRGITIRLLVQQPGTAANGLEGPTLQVTGEPVQWQPKTADDVHPVELSFTPQVPGEYKVGLEIVPLDGELITTNNRQLTYLTVLKGGVNVLFFDKAGWWEQQYLRRIDESPDIQIDFKPIRIGRKVNSTPLDPNWFRPGQYDVYIIGDLPAEVFKVAGSRADALRLLARAVENGAGLLMLGGRQSFGAGGYGKTPLADVLPIDLPAQARENGEVKGEIQMQPTRLGVQHFIMRLESGDQNLKHWQSLPKLMGANRFGALKPVAQKLAENPQGEPLLVVQDYDRGRVAAFAGDTTWLWYSKGFEQEHQQFWRQVVLWLAHKETQGDDNVWVKMDERRIRMGQALTFTCGARDPQGNPVRDAKFAAEINGPQLAGASVPITTEGRDFSGKFAETLAPGDYTLKVQRVVNGQKQGLGVQARFLVYEEDLELTNPVADPALMDEIAQVSGGQALRAEQMNDFLASLAKRGLTPQVQQITTIPLWDNAAVILAFVAILSCEWCYRKWKGLV
ncbi:MAG: glutamine amidotransferase [Planctomycetales bacterium]